MSPVAVAKMLTRCFLRKGSADIYISNDQWACASTVVGGATPRAGAESGAKPSPI